MNRLFDSASWHKNFYGTTFTIEFEASISLFGKVTATCTEYKEVNGRLEMVSRQTLTFPNRWQYETWKNDLSRDYKN